MTDTIFAQVSSTIKWPIRLMNRTTGAGVTGKVKADFTLNLSKNGVGNQSTAAITLTEVDSTNNAGEYIVTVPGATGFVTAVGTYKLYIGYTADLSYWFELLAIVTASTITAVPLGTATFTASSGDGRVTDGTSALSRATVRVVDPSGVAYTSAITGATGLIGTLSFDRAGTYTCYVNKAGYAQNSFSIVVSGTTTTGPLTDVALTATASTTGMTLAELRAYGRMQVLDAVGTEANTKIDGAVNDALGMLSREKEWSWFMTDWDLVVYAAHTTGTLALAKAGTTVTFSSATLPTWVDSSCKLLIGSTWLRIASRTDTSHVEVTTAWPETSLTTSTFVLIKDEYALPADCQKFGAPFGGTDWVWGTSPVSFEVMRQYQIANRVGAKFPGIHAIHNSKLILAPWPNADKLYPAIYRKKPATLVSDSDAADWDSQHLEVLERAIDFQLTRRFQSVLPGDAKTCKAAYIDALNRAVPYAKDSPQIRQFSVGGYNRPGPYVSHDIT